MLAEISLGVRSLLFPSLCPGCRRAPPAEPEGDPLCAPCRTGLIPALPIRRPPSSPLDAAVCLWEYGGAARELVQALKYRGALSLVPFLAGRMAAAVRSGPEGAADAVVAVPLHPARLRERGFNQAEALARALARELGLPYRPGLLTRREPTRPQPGLSREERLRNVRGAFEARLGTAASGKRLLLVDDVLTTGATASACARALKGAGAARVTAVTLARDV